MSDSLAAHRSSLKDAETAISKNAEGIHEQVVSLTEETQELRTVISQMREAEDAARVTLFTRVSEETQKIQDAVESILDISTKRILIAIAAAYLMGVASYPVIAAQFSWVWKLL
jgi:DNA integrity scanning protein DisA with diadenylate cyclase activity